MMTEEPKTDPAAAGAGVAEKRKVLVLGGGGVAGIAWLTGLARGLADDGFDLDGFDTLIGTSAGATVAAQLAGPEPLDELYQRQVDPARQVGELAPRIPYLTLLFGLLPTIPVRKDVDELRRRVGKMAMKARTLDVATRRQVIADRLGYRHWPEGDLRLMAIEAETGRLRALTRESEVGLIDAVAASCAVPGVWPPVRTAGHSFIDGGVPSADNLGQAAGADVVLLLSPLGADRKGRLRRRLQDEIAALESGGARVEVVTPDQGSRAAFGRNPLNPATRTPAAEAGLAQGRRIAGALGEKLGG